MAAPHVSTLRALHHCVPLIHHHEVWLLCSRSIKADEIKADNSVASVLHEFISQRVRSELGARNALSCDEEEGGRAVKH